MDLGNKLGHKATIVCLGCAAQHEVYRLLGKLLKSDHDIGQTLDCGVRNMEAGLEIPSPRDAIKQAAALGLIDDVALWLEFLRVRNLVVHDYLGVPQNEYIKTTKRFFAEGKKLL